MDKFSRVSMASLPASAQPSSSSLESLPVEIQVHILGSLPDVKTLGSLLRASPQYLQVYQDVREDAISQIVCNQITPAILPLAINVLQQSYLRSHRRPRSKVLEFLETFKEPQSILPQTTFSLEISKKLLKTHYIVEYFADAFITDRLNRLSKYIPQIAPLLVDANASLGILGIEHHRLTRAFYHLELYGSLFYDPEITDDVITVQEQSSLFLAKLPDWEIEEFLCVREYLLDSLSGYLDQVEEDFIQDYVEDGPPTDIVKNPYDMRFNHDDEYWYFFSMDGQDARIQNRWMEGSLTRGLKTLQDILESHTADERYDSLGDLTIDRPRNTLKQALDALPCLRDQPEASRCKIATRINSLESPNDAWPWALKKWAHPRKGGLRSHSSTHQQYNALRCWGYLIWSDETLGILGLLEKRQSTDWTYKQKIVVIHSYRAEDLTGRFGNQERRGTAIEVRTRSQYELWRKEALEAVQSSGSID
jgi:hypothetical protein